MVPARQETTVLPPHRELEGSGTTSKIQAAFFAGPIPPPEILARYNDVVPNGAERILAMAERQSSHRESIETRIVDGNLKIQAQGNTRAFILALVIISGGIYLMATGQSGWGFAAIISSIASLVSVFAIAKSEQKKERLDKSTALEERRRR
jgi:uncharacterized membrane protein